MSYVPLWQHCISDHLGPSAFNKLKLLLSFCDYVIIIAYYMVPTKK